MNLNKNERGFGILEVVIASGLLGIAIMGSLRLIENYQSQSNTFNDSVELLVLKKKIHKSLSREDTCIKFFHEVDWDTLTADDNSFHQEKENEDIFLEGILSSKSRDYFLESITVKKIPSFNLSSLGTNETHNVKANLVIILNRKDAAKNKKNFRRSEIVIAPESNPMHLMLSVGKDGAVKSCYLRDSRAMAMANYICNEMGGVLKVGKCLFPTFSTSTSNKTKFYSVNSKINSPGMKYVTLQEMLCHLEKSVVAVELNGVKGIVDPDSVSGDDFDLAQGRPAKGSITKYCPIPQGDAHPLNAPSAFFLEEI